MVKINNNNKIDVMKMSFSARIEPNGSIVLFYESQNGVEQEMTYNYFEEFIMKLLSANLFINKKTLRNNNLLNPSNQKYLIDIVSKDEIEKNNINEGIKKTQPRENIQTKVERFLNNVELLNNEGLPIFNEKYEDVIMNTITSIYTANDNRKKQSLTSYVQDLISEGLIPYVTDKEAEAYIWHFFGYTFRGDDSKYTQSIVNKGLNLRKEQEKASYNNIFAIKNNAYNMFVDNLGICLDENKAYNAFLKKWGPNKKLYQYYTLLRKICNQPLKYSKAVYYGNKIYYMNPKYFFNNGNGFREASGNVNYREDIIKLEHDIKNEFGDFVTIGKEGLKFNPEPIKDKKTKNGDSMYCGWNVIEVLPNIKKLEQLDNFMELKK